MSTTTQRTTVINVRGRDRAALLADPNFVYVGRRCAGWPGSPWGNPYRVGQAKRISDINPQTHICATSAQAVAEFEAYLLRGGLGLPPFNVVLRDRLHELRGKTLGCWCCDFDGTNPPSKPCHAITLATLADGPLGDPPR